MACIDRKYLLQRCTQMHRVVAGSGRCVISYVWDVNQFTVLSMSTFRGNAQSVMWFRVGIDRGWPWKIPEAYSSGIESILYMAMLARVEATTSETRLAPCTSSCGVTARALMQQSMLRWIMAAAMLHAGQCPFC